MKTKKQIRNYVTNKDIAHKIWSDPQILISSLDQKIKLSLTDMLYIYIYTHWIVRNENPKHLRMNRKHAEAHLFRNKKSYDNLIIIMR